jgi:hypothetical protein
MDKNLLRDYKRFLRFAEKYLSEEDMQPAQDILALISNQELQIDKLQSEISTLRLRP